MINTGNIATLPDNRLKPCKLRINRWNLRFLQSEDSSSAVLAYGRVLRDTTGKAVCTVIVNTSQNMMLKNYSNATQRGNRMYIVDENGIVVSHTNQGLIGFALYHMGKPDAGVRESGSELILIRGQPVLYSSYYDVQTRWLTVEELPLRAILASYSDVLLFAATVLLAAILYYSKNDYQTALAAHAAHGTVL